MVVFRALAQIQGQAERAYGNPLVMPRLRVNAPFASHYVQD